VDVFGDPFAAVGTRRRLVTASLPVVLLALGVIARIDRRFLLLLSDWAWPVPAVAVV
jgi:hypothetical protein